MAHTEQSAEQVTSAHVSSAQASALTAQEYEVLEFERNWWRYAGAKEQAIRDQFSLSATRYYQLLNGLLDNPAAVAHDPLLIKRLRRLRERRQAARTARRAGN